MTLPKQKLREVVFQLLYSFDISSASIDDMISLLTKELCITKKTVREAEEKASAILSNKNAIDHLIEKSSVSYPFERIQTVERNILRLGVFELIYDKEQVPPKVAVAEAIRLTRKFATPEAANFVNAVLDNIYKASVGLSPDEEKLSESIEQLAKSEEEAKKASTSEIKDLSL